MIGWIVAGVLWLLGVAIYWLVESDGGLTRVGLDTWLPAIFWPFAALLGIGGVLGEKVAVRWGCHKAYKHGYKDGYAGKSRAHGDGVGYPGWYDDGYSAGSEKANADSCALG
jgi:hypothetical protein